MGKIKHGGKQLPKIYRLKKKTGKIKKLEVKKETEKPRIAIRNISFKATENDIRKLFSPFGEITDINLLKRADGSLVGCGFVEFKTEVEAAQAIFKTNKTELLGRTIACSWAIPKSKYIQKLEADNNEETENKLTIDSDINESVETNDFNKIEEKIVKNEELEKAKEKKDKKLQKKKLAPEERKAKKILKRKKRARVIVRNLPFKATKENVKEFFSAYGKIEDVQIPTKSDGKKIGFCFIQFENVNNADKAVRKANLQQFLDRKVVVDWAIPKNKFESKIKTETENTKKAEDEENKNESEIKKELDCEDANSANIVNGNKSDSENSDDDSVEEVTEEEATDEEDDDEEGDDEYEDQKEKEVKIKVENDEAKSKRFSNDVDEEKTVFLKNVPFRATNEDLKECMEQFGPIYYALICVDKLTEHSKGTAFVKFRNVEDAKRCLQAGTELQLLGQVLDPHPALSKKQIIEKANKKDQKMKDSRNLYLIREGVVLAGSPASKNVSAADMAKRLKIEQWKSQILKNLNMFVSKVRLVVHNLPPTLTDSELKKIIQKHAPSDAIITETRIMKNDRGLGTSKEYAFVGFTKHEDALKTLRRINNNPNIFTMNRRPIVSFSIENRVMVNAKQKRLAKSRQNNPFSSDYVPPKESKKIEDKKDSSKQEIKAIRQNNKRKASSQRNNKKQKPLQDIIKKEDVTRPEIKRNKVNNEEKVLSQRNNKKQRPFKGTKNKEDGNKQEMKADKHNNKRKAISQKNNKRQAPPVKRKKSV